MAQVIRCDGCSTILRADEPYFLVERQGVITRGFADDPRTEFDICSPACLIELANELQEPTC